LHTTAFREENKNHTRMACPSVNRRKPSPILELPPRSGDLQATAIPFTNIPSTAGKELNVVQ